MDLIFVGDRCSDHSPSGGYDQLCELFPDAGWLSGRRLPAGQWDWHRRPTRPVDLSRAVFHVFYGDCSGRALPELLRARFPAATIVSTVHQPVARLAADPDGWASLRPVDAIITVSRVQAEHLAGRGIEVPVHVVPHGVWTRVFARGSDDGTPLEGDGRRGILLVGNYLRDWQTAAWAVTELARAGVASTVVGSAASDHLSTQDPLVTITSGVPERELARLYHTAAALLLPVQDATASNALLEAMAAGCPVVCPRLPSLVEDYLGDDVDAYPLASPAPALARLLEYMQDHRRRSARATTLRERATRFDWSALAARYNEVYQQAAATPLRLAAVGDDAAPQ